MTRSVPARLGDGAGVPQQLPAGPGGGRIAGSLCHHRRSGRRPRAGTARRAWTVNNDDGSVTVLRKRVGDRPLDAAAAPNSVRARISASESAVVVVRDVMLPVVLEDDGGSTARRPRSLRRTIGGTARPHRRLHFRAVLRRPPLAGTGFIASVDNGCAFSLKTVRVTSTANPAASYTVPDMCPATTAAGFRSPGRSCRGIARPLVFNQASARSACSTPAAARSSGKSLRAAGRPPSPVIDSSTTPPSYSPTRTPPRRAAYGR